MLMDLELWVFLIVLTREEGMEKDFTANYYVGLMICCLQKGGLIFNKNNHLVLSFLSKKLNIQLLLFYSKCKFLIYGI